MKGMYGWNGNMPIAFAPDGKTLAVGSHRVEVWDASDGKLLQTLKAGEPVWQLAFTPDEKLLFTTNGISNDVSVIDVATNTVVKSVPVGEQPWGVAVSPN